MQKTCIFFVNRQLPGIGYANCPYLKMTRCYRGMPVNKQRELMEEDPEKVLRMIWYLIGYSGFNEDKEVENT